MVGFNKYAGHPLIITQPLPPRSVDPGYCLHWPVSVSPVTDDWGPEPGLDGCNLSREA